VLVLGEAGVPESDLLGRYLFSFMVSPHLEEGQVVVPKRWVVILGGRFRLMCGGQGEHWGWGGGGAQKGGQSLQGSSIWPLLRRSGEVPE